jgi:hypothetical protein
VQAYGFDLRAGSIRQCLCVVAAHKKRETFFIVQNENSVSSCEQWSFCREQATLLRPHGLDIADTLWFGTHFKLASSRPIEHDAAPSFQYEESNIAVEPLSTVTLVTGSGNFFPKYSGCDTDHN